MIPDLIQTINSLSRLKFDDLSAQRNHPTFYPREPSEINAVGLNTTLFREGKLCSTGKALFLMSRVTIDVLVTKFYHVPIDLHLFLACAAKTETVNVADNHDKKSVYHMAHDSKLRYRNCSDVCPTALFKESCLANFGMDLSWTFC